MPEAPEEIWGIVADSPIMDNAALASLGQTSKTTGARARQILKKRYLPAIWEIITSNQPAHVRFQQLCEHIASSRASEEKKKPQIEVERGTVDGPQEKTLAKLLRLPLEMNSEPEHGCTLKHLVMFLRACNFGGEFTVSKRIIEEEEFGVDVDAFQWEFTCSTSDPDNSDKLRWVCHIRQERNLMPGEITVSIMRSKWFPDLEDWGNYDDEWGNCDISRASGGFTDYAAWDTFSANVLDSLATGGDPPADASLHGLFFNRQSSITQGEFLDCLSTFLADVQAEPNTGPAELELRSKPAYETLKHMMGKWGIPVHCSTTKWDGQLQGWIDYPSEYDTPDPVYFSASFVDETLI